MNLFVQRSLSSAIGATLAMAALSAAPVALADKAAESDAKEERICKRIEETGRRTKKRVCYTKRTWDRMREQSQESLRRVRDRSDTSRSGGDG